MTENELILHQMKTGNTFHLIKTFEPFQLEMGTNQVKKFPSETVCYKLGSCWISEKRTIQLKIPWEKSTETDITISENLTVYLTYEQTQNSSISRSSARFAEFFFRPRREPFWKVGFTSQGCLLSRNFGKLFTTPPSFAKKSIPTRFYTSFKISSFPGSRLYTPCV